MLYLCLEVLARPLLLQHGVCQIVTPNVLRIWPSTFTLPKPPLALGNILPA